MKHFGDITKLSGYNLPVVDVITGGSPCQDLSVAGKRAGLDGERSGLFMEQVRITKEMREHDRSNGRTGDLVRPRYLVWENVPGAFSSNGGKDFQAVLTEIAKIAEPECPDVPLPKNGKWSKSGALFGVGANGCPFSIAWRVHDAQFWGVPQRRKRISLVADFGGLSAPEILFERKGLSGDLEPCGKAGQEAAGAAGEGIEGAGKCLNPWDVQSKHIQPPNGVAEALYSGECRYGGGESYVMQGNGASGCLTGWDVQSKRIFNPDGKSGTLNSGTTEGMNIVPSVLAFEAISFQERAGKPGGGKGILIQNERTGALSTLNNQSVLQSVGVDTYNQVLTGNIACSLTAIGAGDPTKSGPSVLAYGIDQQGGKGGANYTVDVAPTLASDSHGTPHAVCYDARGNGDGKTVCTITGDHQNRVTDYTALCVSNGQLNQMSMAEQANTLDDVSETVSAKYGAGGNNQPLVLCSAGEISPNLVASAYKGPGNTQDGMAIVVIDKEAYNCGKSCTGSPQIRVDNVAPTCRADAHPSGVAYNAIVRRLTPLECERLQGYPDGWTNIGEWVDSKGKKHKDADSPRYKALGNSIALPFWQWMARRICAQYERPVTMASLFDGIGGFPLVFQRCGAVPVWASEIEEFPIAVTKIRFPEEE